MKTSSDDQSSSEENGTTDIQRLMDLYEDWVHEFALYLDSNKDEFKGKTVLNIIAGAGFLSCLCAKYGAVKVYAIESKSELIPVLQKTVDENEFNSIVEVRHGKVSDITIPEKVDIIISEYLFIDLKEPPLFEDIIAARSFLKEGGIIIPQKCEIYVALCRIPEYFDIWDDIGGVKMVSVGEAYRKQTFQDTMCLATLSEENICSEPQLFHTYDFSKIELDDLECLVQTITCVCNFDSLCDGVCIWRELQIFNHKLSLSPKVIPEEIKCKKKRQKLCSIILPSRLDLDEGEPYSFELTVKQNEKKNFDVTFKEEDTYSVQHPDGCSCYNVKCTVIRECLRMYENK